MLQEKHCKDAPATTHIPGSAIRESRYRMNLLKSAFLARSPMRART